MLSESQNTEYKESWRDEHLKWICGFANAQGGSLFIGVNDKREVCGIADAKKLMEDIPNKVRDILGIVVDVDLLVHDDKEYIKIYVPVSGVPLTYRGKYYYRTGSTLQELGGVALNDFIMRKMNITWDATIVPEATLEDLDEDAMRYFVRCAVSENRLSPGALNDDYPKVLRNLELMNKDGQLTMASLLLFGKKIDRWCIGSDFRIGRFGATQADLITQDSISCPLIMMPDQIISVLRSKYLIAPISYDGLHRKEPIEIPEKGLREILCNAIVHRYMLGAHTQMKVMDDHITLWNDGTLPPTFTIETLMGVHESCPRNKLIAKAFYLAGFIESWGRGYEKIRQDFTASGLEMPTFEEVHGGFLATIKREVFVEIQGITVGNMSETCRKHVGNMSETDGDTSDTVRTAPEPYLSQRQKSIINLLQSKPDISAKAIAKILSVTSRTIERELAAMQKGGILTRIGTYGGYWQVQIPVQ